MNDPTLVQVRNGFGELHGVPTDFGLAEQPVAANVVRERAMLAQLEQQIDRAAHVLEATIEAHDARMRQLAVNADFDAELIFQLARERLAVRDLERVLAARLDAPRLVAHREAALAEKLVVGARERASARARESGECGESGESARERRQRARGRCEGGAWVSRNARDP